MTGISDSFQRPINYLRISVTDRCNLRCIYCMPEDGVTLMTHDDILSYEEIFRVVKAAAEMGIDRVRLTGGEPLVRAGISSLVKLIAGIESIHDIAVTTNGLLLPKYAAELKEAGLNRVNISLDTLNPDKFRQITRCGELKDTLEGIEAAHKVGLDPVKINMVVMANVNDDEIVDFASKTVTDGWHVRYIEHMPVLDEEYMIPRLVSVSEIRDKIESLGALEPTGHAKGNGPAKYFRLPGASGTIGFITPVTEHFCYQCNRLRLTADGKLRPCLLSESEIGVREALRRGATLAEIKTLIEQSIACKPAGHNLAEGRKRNGRPFSQVGG